MSIYIQQSDHAIQVRDNHYILLVFYGRDRNAVISFNSLTAPSLGDAYLRRIVPGAAIAVASCNSRRRAATQGAKIASE